MPIIAKPLTDKEHGYPRLWVVDGFLRGERPYYINTHDEERCLQALGLPQVGEAWGPQYPRLIVSGYGEPEYLGGTDTSPQDGGGWSKIAVIYAEPPLTVLPPGDTKWTDIRVGTVEVTWTDDIRVTPSLPTNDPLRRAINNGDGVGREFGIVELDVHTFRTDLQPPPLTLWFDLIGSVNDASVALPNLWGMFPMPDALVGELRYRGFTPGEPGRLNIAITHHFAYAKDHYSHWFTEGPNGDTGSEVVSHLYPSKSFVGLL